MTLVDAAIVWWLKQLEDKMGYISKIGIGMSFFAACICGLTANAAVYDFAGDTTGKPTFERPNFSGTQQSAPVWAVPYVTFEFSVDTTGEYTFLSNANYDNATFLYNDSFQANSALVNYIIGNDDFASARVSGFTAQLTRGVNYIFVNTGRAPENTGPFTAQIAGPGEVQALAAVPEPETYAMLLTGLGMLGVVARRKRFARESSKGSLVVVGGS